MSKLEYCTFSPPVQYSFFVTKFARRITFLPALADGRGACYWKKQPETEAELKQAFAIFDGQEAGCHRYAGHNPEIMSRIGFDSCDYAPPRTGFFYSTTAEPAPRELLLLPFEAPGLLRRLWNKLRRH